MRYRDRIAELTHGSQAAFQRILSVANRVVRRFTVGSAAGNIGKLDPVAAAVLRGQRADGEQIGFKLRRSLLIAVSP